MVPVDRYHHGNLKSALLKAALLLVGKLGAEALTLREVARRAGVSHNAPYRHFKSKEDLVAALATEALEQLLASIRKATAAATGPSERLRAAAHAYLGFALSNPPRFGIMFRSAFDRDAYPAYVAAYTDSVTLLSELVREQEIATDTGVAGELVWASIHGITELGLGKWLRGGTSAELETLVDSALETLLAGLKSKSRPARR